MSIKIGIPRGLFYYQYFPLWKVFFEELGAEIIISDYSNKNILDAGVKNCVDEACLPVKLFHGHVLNIKGRVDYLFIPRYTSISKKEYICPKFGGLPDMVRNSLRNLPPIIDTEINLRKSKGNSLKAAMEIGLFFTDDRRSIRNAYNKAVYEYKKYRQKLSLGVLPNDILRGKSTLCVIKNDKISPTSAYSENKKLNIALIGHVYNVYDNFINMDLISKLRKNNINIITTENINRDVIREKSHQLNKRMFWNFGKKAIGTALHILDRDDIDGIIYVMSFGCGIDSFICDMAERRIRKNSNIPFIILTIDEHSGEAGMDTRIEAFIDMIRWREKNEGDISEYR